MQSRRYPLRHPIGLNLLNLQQSRRNFSSFNQGFTLVELIVVVTILSILGAIGFISLDGYSLRSRDSVRASHLSLLSKGFEVQKSKGALLPIPDSPVVITASSVPIGNQGYAGNTVLSIIGVSPDVQDPKDLIRYTYSVNSTQTKWQILGFYESSGLVHDMSRMFPYAYADAADYSSRFISTRGDSLGVLLSSGSLVPVQVAGSSIDIATTTTSYKAILSNTSQLNGTGSMLYQVNSKASCKRILETGLSKGDGKYEINPQGTPVQVYCDMTTDGGGWTLILSAGNGGIVTAGNTGAVNTDFLLTKKPGGKLSDDLVNFLYSSQFRTTSTHTLFQDKKLYARLVEGKKWKYTLDWYQTEHIKTGLIYDKNANYINGQGLWQIASMPQYFTFNHWGDMDVWFSYGPITRYFESPCCATSPEVFLWVK